MVPQRPTRSNDPLPLSIGVASGRASAQALPSVAAAVRELLERDVGAWSEHGLLRIKERTVRSVFRGVLADTAVHVKLFRADTFADKVRDLVRPDRGATEARNLQALRGAGLRAVEPLAHGFASDAGQLRGFVMTRTVDGVPFTFAAPPAVHAAIGALLRSLHERGVHATDLHPGNVLVDAAGAPWLLDLTSVRHVGTFDLTLRARSLAFFCQDLDGGALDARARELLRAYLAAGELPAAFDTELQLATRRWRAAAVASFGRRALRSCRHTEVPPRRRATPRWHWHLDGAPPAIRAACEAFAAAPPPPHKTGRRGSVWLLDDLAVKARDAGKATRLWRAAYWLTFARVPIATPVALRLHGGRGHVFARRVGPRSLADELADGTLAPHAVSTTARQLGEALGRLHAHGLGNRDLKFDNLVRDPRSGIVCMVDLDGVRRHAANDARGRGADLGRLLAAFRGAGEPGGAATVRAWLRGYLRAHRRLLQTTPLRRVLRRAEQRAGEWASAHRA